MTMANPRLHIICGACGNNGKDMLSFEIRRNFTYENEGEENERRIDAVLVSCKNCSSLTNLSEVIERKEK